MFNITDYNSLVTAHRSTTNTTTSKNGSEEDVAGDDADLVYGIDGCNTEVEEVTWEDWEASEEEAREDESSQKGLSSPVADNTDVNLFTHLLTLLTETKGRHPISNLAVTSRLRHDIIRVYRAKVPKSYAAAIRILKVIITLR